MNRSCVLIVDDDTALLEALPQALNLRIEGVEVHISDTALEALKLIREHDYDAIVSDIKMPGMDGLALLEKIKELRPDVPTLLITGHGEHDLAVRALRGGAYDFIQKPIDRDYLVAALQRAIQVHQLRSRVFEQQLALALHAKSLERIVQKRTHELVEANATKDKLLKIVSHELKTPLTSLKGMTQLLLRQSKKIDSAEVVSMGLEDMERSLRRIEVLVNDLLDTSLIETNMFVLHRRRCDLVELCRHLIDEYTAGTGPELTFEIPGEPVEVEVDADRISQVIINLLTNARKYSPKGSPITVTLQQVGYEAIVSVQDMGIGIPADMQDSIFEQFFRVPGVEVQTGSHTGLGLGLYISRKIAERHGGHIDVESAPENGSTFSVVLPMYVDTTNDEVDAAQLAPHTQGVWTIAH
ncbi:MAG TPA: hybrid sensor histidine kinase/response regulator [Ktedonobacter sp.]|jgi:signal transduction histidine kinase|nr:hybrid sensor histidine kinase/response regulator [Ktedonobacter sp.]HAG97307.1 hybrid sensor histidine kinase/response regulator [Ktedonobacter sp.]HAT43564.1 hybrid sensor histidine kinase/response regulator [Ktedonobacter sp.]HBE24252.1 hybrid sensor histidine kinase/response regulator [Ktedonobacter sp.]HCF86691.1 hybrid sensor histidine kinase/response regulator [Ktedonobacter sp.]